MAAMKRLLLKASPLSSSAINCLKRCISTAAVSETAKSPSYPLGSLPPRSDPKLRNVQWVFLGCPGVRKGNYASRLSSLLAVPHIATGDLVREELSSNGPLSHQLAEIVNQGKLVSDEIIINLLSKRLEAGAATGESGFIPSSRRVADINLRGESEDPIYEKAHRNGFMTGYISPSIHSNIQKLISVAGVIFSSSFA
ncbi:hypothetical protein CsSME_00018637 [Camellia sinensis var. sinensis]|uniref:adenylate kinase-like n=1 Tax=Camellia sinensis TaxID=4442 RepID=UPI0010364C17|nr:adenylate kinase-like [Camellia sinensis]